jgi:dTDP-4-amino-4,6-dideoxygalactose transaminase
MTVSRQVQFSDNTIGAEEIAAVTEVLTGRWLSLGPVTRNFERAFADALGAPDAVAVSTGTAALHVALAALGVGPGDEVITPSLTFVAGAAMTRLLGATPVFADVVSERDPTLDPDSVAALLTPRTRAVIVTHFAGFAARIERLRDITGDRGIALVEDAAHAPVVRSPAGMLGTIGDIGCFSCYATKNVTTGEGGLVVSADPALLAACRSMRSHHMAASGPDQDYDIDALGMNYRPTEIGAAVGLIQLGRLAQDRASRLAVTNRYRARLAAVPALTLPFADRDPAEDSALHLFPVLLPAGADRAAVRAALRERGVPTSVHYPPTHRLSYYRDLAPTEGLPVTDAVAGRLLSLPLHARLTEDDATYVAAALTEVLR